MTNDYHQPYLIPEAEPKKAISKAKGKIKTFKEFKGSWTAYKKYLAEHEALSSRIKT